VSPFLTFLCGRIQNRRGSINLQNNNLICNLLFTSITFSYNQYLIMQGFFYKLGLATFLSEGIHQTYRFLADEIIEMNFH